GLWNGDVGLVEAGGEGEDPRVFFGDGEGGGRTCSLSRLPSHETVFAMTVHKSQGSEFHGVVILLPEAISPVICRELLYTAVTRAREKVVIHAEPGLFRQAVEQRIRRFSGLRDLLWGQ
ncbi:MAG: ATP-binding domain-containing protein, partial [Acidobacteriota bacterium]